MSCSTPIPQLLHSTNFQTRRDIFFENFLNKLLFVQKFLRKKFAQIIKNRQKNKLNQNLRAHSVSLSAAQTWTWGAEPHAEHAWQSSKPLNHKKNKLNNHTIFHSNFHFFRRKKIPQSSSFFLFPVWTLTAFYFEKKSFKHWKFSR